MKARLKDMPAQSRTALETAVTDDPGNAFAVSALGGWHIEVVRGGGAPAIRLRAASSANPGAQPAAPGSKRVRKTLN